MTTDRPKFRNGSNARYTKSLFQELTNDPEAVLYTLKSEDTEVPSLYKLYIAEDDVTEYTFANKYFENWEHWDMIASASWFKEYVSRWRKELKLKLESLALQNIIKEMRDPNSKNKYAASKTVLDQINKNKPLRGRPTKEEVKGELKRQTFAERQLAEDMKRISGDADT